MELFKNKRMKVSCIEVGSADAWIKDCEKVLKENSGEFALYRCHIEEFKGNVLTVSFLASDIRGNFKNPKIYLDLGSNSMFYDEAGGKFNFRDEEAVASALVNLIAKLTDNPIPVRQIFFDFPERNHIQRVHTRVDPKSPKEYALFLTSANVRADYLYSDAAAENICSEELAADWLKVIKEDEEM